MSEPGTLPLPELGLSAEEAADRFGRLQQKLVPLWTSIRTFNQEEQTIVVIPSITAEVDITGTEMQAYEELSFFSSCCCGSRAPGLSTSPHSQSCQARWITIWDCSRA